MQKLRMEHIYKSYGQAVVLADFFMLLHRVA